MNIILIRSTVIMNGNLLKKDTDYTVSCSDNTNTGTASVAITGKGNYTGTITKSFQITPAKNTLTVKVK